MGAWIAWPFALLAGALVTVQAGTNTALKRSFGEPMPALVVNYLLGLGPVDGFDQDESAGKCDERCVILCGLLAA
jgi:hypothetical protein